MMDLQTWQEANGTFLSAALRWLRARLEQCERRGAGADTSEQGQGDLSRVGHAEQERLAAEAMHESAQFDPPPALIVLADRLGLSSFEQGVLLLCAGMELDTRIPALCADAQGDGHKPYPTFALAMIAFDDPAWEALSPRRPLRYWRLLEVAQSGNQPLTASALRVDERVVSYLKGLNELDDRLSSLLIVADEVPDAPLAPSQLETAERISQALGTAASAPIIELVGPDEGSKSTIAGWVARAVHRRLLRISAALLPVHLSDIENIGRLCQRESLLLPILVYLEAEDIQPAGSDRATAVRQFLERCGAPLFLSVREPWTRVARSCLSFDAEKPTRSEQERVWRDVLEADENQLAERLFAQFNLDVQSIHAIASGTAAVRSDGDRSIEMWNACSDRVRPRLDSLAHRIKPQAKWDDLVLPIEQTELLRQIAAQVTHRTKVYEQWELGRRVQRGLGIGALFAGESGTGKTLAAEVLSNHLGLSLYRIDLSSVVNKYIGETEKNLRRLFDAAEDGGCILFFDEADALFGKRTEVKDSHDRYANIEINYLLQRIEAFRGLAILATNLRNTLDAAFVRRLRFIVSFPFPSIADRRRMWEHVFPKVAPVRGLDYERLSRFALTGAAIRNVAVNAAFLAADDGAGIEMRHVLNAARSEFTKLERPINVAEFSHRESAEAVR